MYGKPRYNIELLTILKISKVIHNESVETLWNYFVKMWLKIFPPSLWNIKDYRVYHHAGRTNNCLEWYYRRIGDFFLHAHPNLAKFISVVKAEFEFIYSEKYKEARKNAISFKYTSKYNELSNTFATCTKTYSERIEANK
ncbi:hypothetical protein HZS_992 [Henneguya salminicola]|nr:hypothetical protein HZS_992 [Henneguya salminicola]